MRNSVTEDILRDHLEEFERNLDLWNGTFRLEEDESLGEVAYQLLLHAGMYTRYRGCNVLLNFFKREMERERYSLLLEACDYVALGNYAVAARRVAKAYRLDDPSDGIEDFESHIYLRDQLDAVMKMVEKLGSGLDGHNDYQKAHRKALARIKSFDKVLEEYWEETIENSQTVLFLVSKIVRPCPLGNEWWGDKLDV